jgi:uncharacterized protein (DUF111 family)
MLAKHMNMQLNQLERMNKEMEVRSTRKANVDIRNKWQQAKNIKNYQSEYDRIRSHMSNSAVPHETVARISGRKSVLEKLGAQAFDGMY